MKSVISARCFFRNPLRATWTIICERPIASSWVNRGRDRDKNSGSRPNGNTAVIRSTLPSFSIAFSSGKRTSMIVTSLLSCRCCFASIARKAMSIALPVWFDARILPLQILDSVDRAVLSDDEGIGVISGYPILEHVGNDAQIRHPGVLDRESKGRVGECCAIELAGSERGHLGRGAGEVSELGNVSLARMRRETGLSEHHAHQVRRRHHPAEAEMISLPSQCRPMAKQRWRRKRQHDSCREDQKILASSHALAP